MRQTILILTAVLAVSGVALFAVRTGAEAPGAVPGWARFVSLLHIWGGLFFLVAFPLYAWDHVRANRRWLRRLAPLTVSGVVQLSAAALLIVSGLVLLLYGEAAWVWLRNLHHGLTYLIVLSIAGHFLSPKR